MRSREENQRRGDSPPERDGGAMSEATKSVLCSIKRPVMPHTALALARLRETWTHVARAGALDAPCWPHPSDFVGMPPRPSIVVSREGWQAVRPTETHLFLTAMWTNLTTDGVRIDVWRWPSPSSNETETRWHAYRRIYASWFSCSGMSHGPFPVLRAMMAAERAAREIASE